MSEIVQLNFQQIEQIIELLKIQEGVHSVNELIRKLNVEQIFLQLIEKFKLYQKKQINVHNYIGKCVLYCPECKIYYTYGALHNIPSCCDHCDSFGIKLLKYDVKRSPFTHCCEYCGRGNNYKYYDNIPNSCHKCIGLMVTVKNHL